MGTDGKTLKPFQPAERIKITEGNIWQTPPPKATMNMMLIVALRELIHEIAAQSPIQPVANLGTGFMSESSFTPKGGMSQDILT